MEIGGYFEIEYSNIHAGCLHPNAIKLNTGRNCLEYILSVNDYKKIYIPYYICEAVLEPVKKLDIAYEFYAISSLLEPVAIPVMGPGEAFLYVNYFGLKSAYIQENFESSSVNVIIDNSQALFSSPVKNVNCFYSLRKFAGVADGAFLYSEKKKDHSIFAAADSESRSSHLYIRKEYGAQQGYNAFVENEKKLTGLPIQTMSESTIAFTKNYDFDKNKSIRETNFFYLYTLLKDINALPIDIKNNTGPLCFPFLPLKRNIKLKQLLIKEKIYVPTFWPKVNEWLPLSESFEMDLLNNLLCLPIDQRYSIKNMDFIVKKILQFYGEN